LFSAFPRHADGARANGRLLRTAGQQVAAGN